MQLQCGNKLLDLSRPRIMGIVNVTPDSFSDGGRHNTTDAAIMHARQLIKDGADIVDIGGESTRPGATPVDVAVELARVLPVVSALRDCGAIISIDTRQPEVMQAAIAAGADMINDVYALRMPGAVEVAAQSGAALCLMHMQGEPETMQQSIYFDDVVQEVFAFLERRVAVLQAAGVDRTRLLVDPGFGFGKALQHNLQLLKCLDRFSALKLPVLVGLSRKSMLGKITGRAIDAREAASLAANLYALAQGAMIFRVHDVGGCRDALTVWQAIGDM